MRNTIQAVLLLALLTCGCAEDGSKSPSPLACGPSGGEDASMCPEGYACLEDVCVCVPDCSGKACGPDGCEGSCGECPVGEVCFLAPWALAECCTPDCTGVECGDDGCGGSCGGCAAGEVCRIEGVCCVQECDGRQCGDDSCGGNCGLCPEGYSCVEAGGDYKCEPDCGWFCEALDCGIGGYHGECDCGTCHDEDPCTLDSCEFGFCLHAFIEGCCVSDVDCMDCVDAVTGMPCPPDPPGCLGASCVPNTCTDNFCEEEFCQIDSHTVCCVDDFDCDDENPCSEDQCIQETHYCIRVFEPGCCANNGMCNDGDICTYDSCDIPAGEVVGEASTRRCRTVARAPLTAL